jgi:hypothetical protein
MEYGVSVNSQNRGEWSYPNPFHDFSEGMDTIILKQTWLYTMTFFHLNRKKLH